MELKYIFIYKFLVWPFSLMLLALLSIFYSCFDAILYGSVSQNLGISFYLPPLLVLHPGAFGVYTTFGIFLRVQMSGMFTAVPESGLDLSMLHPHANCFFWRIIVTQQNFITKRTICDRSTRTHHLKRHVCWMGRYHWLKPDVRFEGVKASGQALQTNCAIS